MVGFRFQLTDSEAHDEQAHDATRCAEKQQRLILINESFLTGLSWWAVSLAATTQMIIMRFNASELAYW